MRQAASVYAVYQAAEAAGYQLDAEAAESIDSTIAEIKTYADQNNMSIDEYIEAVFGRGCDEESYRHYMKVVNTASAYPATIEYTVAEKAARDAENPADFDNVAFYYYINNASTIEAEEEAAAEEATQEETADENADATTDENADAATDENADAATDENADAATDENADAATDENADAATDENADVATDENADAADDDSAEEATETDEEAAARRDAEAKAAAEKMAAEFDTDDDAVSIYADYTRNNLENSGGAIVLPEEALDWLFGEAEEGEVKMFTMEADAETEGDENDYIVIKFITNKDYFTANYLSITIADDAEETTEEETAESEEQEEKTAAEKVAEIKASLEADPSEENFRELILANLDHDHEEGEEHDHSDEGLTEDATRYGIANTSKDLFTWLMLEERKAGDWTVIEMDGQTVFYFYLEQGQQYRDICIENTLLNEWYEELTTNAIANCDYDAEAVPENDNIKFYVQQ